MANNETLYSLSQAYRTAIEGGFIIDEETGEIIWEPDDLDALELALADKAEAVVAVQREYAGKASMVNNEIRRLQELKKSYEGHSERLKKYLLACVQANDGQAIETPVARISVRKSKSVDVFDVREVPDDYMRYSEPTPNKTLIKKAIESGTPVAGCALVVNENLQIK